MPLSKAQQAAVHQRGRFALIACPGSGKTLTVAERCALRLTQWDRPHAGIAVLSFTNVAHREIAGRLAAHGLSIDAGGLHFLGTLDSFINTWLFLPFGPLLMGCEVRPTLIGFDGLKWNVGELLRNGAHRDCHACSLLDLTHDEHGRLVLASRNPRMRRRCPCNRSHCHRLKETITKKGYATQVDAAYWALRVLERFPSIGRALTKRFPEIIVDEAQDTSRAQVHILDRLCELGLAELVLAGDPDQAIFEWRDAEPGLLVARTENVIGWERHLTLGENRRSSQAICDVARGFAQYHDKGMVAVGDLQGEIPPLLIDYDPNDPASLIQAMHTTCREHHIPLSPVTTAVLVRSRSMLTLLLGCSGALTALGDPWATEITHLTAGAAFWFSHDQDIPRSMRMLEHALARICFKDRHCTESELRTWVRKEMGEREWRSGLYRLLKRLPGADLPLNCWTSEAARQLSAGLHLLGWPVPDTRRLALRHKKRLNGVVGLAQLPVSLFFRQGSAVMRDVTIETIHSAKGKSYEAVLFVVSPGKKDGNARQLADRNNPDYEELRIAYVALTRPRKLLIVAVPQETDPALLWRFGPLVSTNRERMGSQLPPSTGPT